MSTFIAALQPLLINEGGYSNVSGDSGGETYRGISRTNYPQWKGWDFVDAAKPLRDEEIIVNSDLNDSVQEFYKLYFWDAERLGEITDQKVGTKLLDMCVNMGSHQAIKLLQQVLVNKFRYAINIDGILGKETLFHVNAAGNTLIQQLRNRCIAFYESLVEERPEDQKFLNGWLKRANQ